MRCHIDNPFAFACSKFGSGYDVIGHPIKKCPGVRAERSLGLDDNGMIGLELRMASIYSSKVKNSSYRKEASPIIRLI